MTYKRINIIIADDHPVMLNGLEQQLKDAGYAVIGVGKNGAEALQMVNELQPDVAILDLKMPVLSGLEVVRLAKKEELKTKFIIMTYHNSKSFVVQAKQIGVDGYLLKEDDIVIIQNCIDNILKGNFYYSKSLNFEIDMFIKREFQRLNLLTPSERTIIRLIAQSKSSDEIGKILSVSKRTVEKHRSNIISKLDLNESQISITKWVSENSELIRNL